MIKKQELCECCKTNTKKSRQHNVKFCSNCSSFIRDSYIKKSTYYKTYKKINCIEQKELTKDQEDYILEEAREKGIHK